MTFQEWIRRRAQCGRIGWTIILALMLLTANLQPGLANVATSNPVRRVHVPYWATGTPYPSRSIFWMGKVDPYSNYADIRMVFDDTQLKVEAHVMDRLLWQDSNGNAAAIPQWDAVSLYLKLDGSSGSAPTTQTYRIETEISGLQAAYRGNGTGWSPISLPFTTDNGWRGDQGPNSGSDSKGWVATFQIPFSSLGLSAHPAMDTVWGLGVVIHDRDDAGGSMLQDTLWPDAMSPNNPATWGQLSFGWAHYATPNVISQNSITVRGGENGASVNDADVGGHFTCGGDYGPDYWPGWGSANYQGESQINIQNQWDISDWPCFSKYFITFPLGSIPAGKQIISATFTMYLFGTAGGGDYGTPPDSFIQAFTVDSDWNEKTITWNNAPKALENISGLWVVPTTSSAWVTYNWDISLAVAQAYASGQPLRLAFYSADGDYHTGKYFISSDWSETKGHPFITISYGSANGTPGNLNKKYFLPAAIRK